ncbi:MAG: hypothetical protein KGJ51_04545 [Acidobacteriota bacterium]|nr:hypothetical protein [Acidobacteriota bacterium]
MTIDPKRIAAEYYFGDLQYWQIPGIFIHALEEDFDGPALRRIAGLAILNRKDILKVEIEPNDIDSAFREMGVDAPISKQRAQMILATECAAKAMNGQWNVFDAATHIRVHLCGLSEPPEPLMRIVQLSEKARGAPRAEWSHMETDLKLAIEDFCARREAPSRLAALGGSDPNATAPLRRRPHTIP